MRKAVIAMSAMLGVCTIGLVCALAQSADKPKIAVYATGGTAEVNSAMGTMILTALVKDGKYLAVERTDAFLAEIAKEQVTQRSGAVDERQISKLGKQFGVRFVCVANITGAFGSNIVSARIIDVETAEVAAMGKAHSLLKTMADLMSASNSVATAMFAAPAASETASKVAVYVTGLKNENESRAFGTEILAELVRDGTYRAVERSNAFLAEIAKEQAKQRTGAIDDNQISKLGKQFGVQYVCIANVTRALGSALVSARIVDVETAVVRASGNTESKLESLGDLAGASVRIGDELYLQVTGRARGRTAGPQAPPSPPPTVQAPVTVVQTPTTPTPAPTTSAPVIDMVFVKGGTFRMGCTGEQGSDCYENEKPAHSVTVSDFYIGKYPVTQKQWVAVMGSNPSYLKRNDNLPVEQVSWNDVQEFISRLNSMTGRRYRLLTEAEWEFAARGGASSRGYKYSGSNNIFDVAWHKDNSGGKTQPVGGKAANELGIYDMSGNVLEWVSDWYGSYSSSSQTNPQGPSSGFRRVIRGGGWTYGARNCRVSDRGDVNPDFRGGSIGFRLALPSP